MLLFAADGDLVSMRVDGSARRQVLTPGMYDVYPAWSADGKYVAYIASEEGSGDIFITRWRYLYEPEKATNITSSPSYDDGTSSWSPDGRQIAFTSFHVDRWGIFTAELLLHDDAEPVLLRQRRLTSNNRYDGHPTWSPDNTWIAYTSDRGFRWQIYLTHTSGTWTLPMTGTTNLRSTAYPAWSPDGSKLAFSSTFDGSWDIYVMQTDGSDLVQLTSHPAQDWHPTWSPDSEWIAFVSDRSGAGDIYLISTDGTELVQLTDNTAAEDSPEWKSP
jgi:Tol biopolymer transport system component